MTIQFLNQDSADDKNRQGAGKRRRLFSEQANNNIQLEKITVFRFKIKPKEDIEKRFYLTAQDESIAYEKLHVARIELIEAFDEHPDWFSFATVVLDTLASQGVLENVIVGNVT